jgi:hypothetical protein
MTLAWATVIISIAALISLSVTVLLVASAFRQALHNASRSLERLDARHEKHLDTVLDRLMAIKWEDYAAVRSLDEDQVGGFYPPMHEADDETAVLEVEGPKWGHLHRTAERLQKLENEETLINEDFDEEGSPRKKATE